MAKDLMQVLKDDLPEEMKALFAFDSKNSDEEVIFKFNLWLRYFFLKYLSSKDCDAHKEMDMNNVLAYRGKIRQYVNIAFRGFSKTARTKLFLAFCISNDLDHSKRFIRALSADYDNAKQSVTDIYNMFVQPKVKAMYPEIFAQTDTMREETMNGFTTSTGIKVLAKQIGVDQRGKIMEDAKSDLDWYDDIETRTTIRSAVITQKIWENMEEARTGLAIGGCSIYTANYFSEAGNIHRLVIRESEGKIVQITPIMDKEGTPTWDRYSKEDIAIMKKEDEDFEGERMCNPQASKDVFFSRESLEKMPVLQPKNIIGGLKMFNNYNPSHRYGSGHDVAGGVHLDSSSSVFIDFDCIPAQVVGTYHSNEILPEAFGDAVYDQGKRFGLPIQAIENNKYDQVILKAKQLGVNLFMTPAKQIKIGYSKPATYGWNTNSLTKYKMFNDFKEAVDSGLIELNDLDLINESKSYTRNDLIDDAPDARLTTRHFDLLTAAAIAWQMRTEARPRKKHVPYVGLADVKEENPAI